MWLVGLTGGIATGKSSVSATLRRAGVRVVDLDELAREVVQPGKPALAAIVATFGADVLLPDGSLDRARLGELVFADAGARARVRGDGSCSRRAAGSPTDFLAMARSRSARNS